MLAGSRVGGGCGALLSCPVPLQGLMCPEHKEEVTHYCKTCQRLVCQLCRVRRTHTSHKITPVLSAYQALRVRAAGPGLSREESGALAEPRCRWALRVGLWGLPAPCLTSFLQEKLTKSLAYILSSQDTVQTQIAELEETVKHTEVRAEGACP